MRPRAIHTLMVSLATAGVVAALTSAGALGRAPRGVDVVPLAEGVYAVLRTEPVGLAVNANSLLVIAGDAVIVVDAQFTRAATLETIAALRGVTNRSVTHVVNTHWHDDHVAGNQVYRDSFPDVQFVQHANTRVDLRALGEPNREATRTGAPALADEYERRLGVGLGVDSTPASAAERASLRSALDIIRLYFADLEHFRLPTDGPTVQDRLTLGSGDNALVVRWLGRGNTRGDLVVHVPRRDIVATGDLLVAPVPFAFGSYPAEWIAVLDSIAALRPRILVPGHGPVMRDLSYLRRVRGLLADVSAQGSAAVERGDSVAQLQREIQLEEHRRGFAGDEKWMNWMFTNFFARPATTAAYQQARAQRGYLTPGAVAITNVHVISMAGDSVVRDATVLVRDGRIAAIGRDVEVPANVRRLDGRGRYLIPGLADMHTHLYADEALPDSVAPAELGVMLANGVTTARLMIGAPHHFRLRDAVAAGRIVGPKLWVASPQLAGREFHNGIVVTTPDDARTAVNQVADAGYDFVKLTLFITPAVYDAIVDEAAKRRIRVVGHVEPEIGVARALEAGQQIEHLDGYFEAVLAAAAPMRTSLTQQRVFDTTSWASLDHMDDEKIARIAGATARAGVWSSPTLNVFNKAFADRESDAEIRGRPDWRFLPPAVRTGYMRARERYWSDANLAHRTEARRRRYVEVRNRLVKAIADSGGRLLTGSDTPEWFHAYGWGLHRELQAFVAAGLTPFQSLAAATRNAAEFLGQSAEWGTIEPGKRADLVLLDANPLEDIRHTMGIAGVMVGGRWLDRAELDRLIEVGSAAIDGAPRD